jgi:hypothetical protein
MKARVWAFMLDLSRYEAGMKEFEILANEILTYLVETLRLSKDYGEISDVSIAFAITDNKLQLRIAVVKH